MTEAPEAASLRAGARGVRARRHGVYQEGVTADDTGLDGLAEAINALRAPLIRLVAAREERGGLTSAQHLTLMTLAPGPLAMGELAEATGVAVSTATRMVQGLRRAGFVEPVEVTGADARRRYVALTAAGRTAMEQETRAQLTRIRRTLVTIPERERALVHRGLATWTAALEALEGRRRDDGPPAATL